MVLPLKCTYHKSKCLIKMMSMTQIHQCSKNRPTFQKDFASKNVSQQSVHFDDLCEQYLRSFGHITTENLSPGHF